MIDWNMDKTVVVGVCIKSEFNEILMVQEAQWEISWLFNIPAGRLDSWESIFEGAIRETKEETGYDVELDSVLCIQYLEKKCLLKIVFNATIISGDINFDANEIMDVKWIPIEDLEKMTAKELRSYDSNINIIRDAKNNKRYPLDIVENLI